MTSFLHPAIGRVIGKGGDKCTQFLGVKYATLKDRFADAELVRYDGSGIDATRFGPQVISPPGGVDMEFGFIQQSLPKPDFPGMSELNGLNLNITTPGRVDTVNSTKRLPVLVFIHGGGFSIGANWWPQYDFARLVRLSTDLGTPIIGVGINYRLGALGFLTSPELRAAGYKPNNAFRDQRMALQWIKENIQGFGGDPDNINVSGESAGAVSSGYLLLSEEKLARRVICLGGCPPLMGMLPLDAADQTAKSTMTALGLQDAPSSEMVTRLLDLPAEDFFTKITPAIQLLPTVDGDIIPKQFTFESLSSEVGRMASSRWIESIFLAYSELDASIMAFAGLLQRKVGRAAAFRASAAKTLHGYPAALASLLDIYSLSEVATTSATDDDVLMRLLTLMSDLIFFLPAVELAAKFPNDSFVAAFNEPNPWEGLFKGHASHILDVAFLFQNFNDSLDQTQTASAVAFGTDVIAFVNGAEPWKTFNGSGKGAGVYADGKRRYSDKEMTNRHDLLQLAHDSEGPGLDRLVLVATGFMDG